MRFVFYIVALFGVVTLPVHLSAQAATEDLKGFWQKDAVTNYNSSVAPNSSQQVMYHDYPLAVDRAKELAQQAEFAVKAQEAQKLAQSAEVTPLPFETPLSRDQIITKFGLGEEPEPVRAVKDAPREMGGLIAALNIGDKELAWHYAVLLAKRDAAVQSTVTEAATLQRMAREALGMSAAPSAKSERDSLSPTRLAFSDFYEKTRADQLQKPVRLDETTGQVSSEGPGSLAVAPKPQVPVDPEGKVQILVFLDERARNAKEIADSLRPLKEMFKGDHRISIEGRTKRTYNVSGLKYRSAEISFPFPLANGEALALDWRIHSYPTIVFVAMTTKQSYRLEGIPSVEQIRDTVTAMRGGR